MGALFRSGHITIWTDVDGVYSADPRKVRGLRLLWGEYLEALGGRGLVEMAGGGDSADSEGEGGLSLSPCFALVCFASPWLDTLRAPLHPASLRSLVLCPFRPPPALLP